MLGRVALASPETIRWRDVDGAPRAGDHAAFAAACGGRECVLLLDQGDVTVLDVELPVSDLRTARQAAPFAVEERLAQPLEELHIALAALGGPHFAVAALAVASLARLRDALAASALPVRLITPAAWALPWSTQSWTIAVDDDDGGHVLVRYARGAALALDLAQLPRVLALLRAATPQVARVVVHAAAVPAGWPEALFAGLAVEWRPPLRDVELLAELAQAPPLALIEGTLARAGRIDAQRWWRRCAAAAAVLALAWPGWLAWEHHALEARLAALASANEATFHAAFPAVTRIVNPRVQAEQALAAARAAAQTGPDFLALLARIDSVNALGLPAGARVTRLNFAAGVVELGIETDAMDTVESVRSALLGAGLVADTVSAEAAEGKVVAQLRVQVGS